MTNKVYKSAMGKEVDLGALLLQNEHVRAVGNMNVNARGDVLDENNRVIDRKNQQVQRQYKRTTNTSADTAVYSSTKAAKLAKSNATPEIFNEADVEIEQSLEAIDTSIEPVATPEPISDTVFGPTGEGGLAAAIARSRLIKQEKEKTLRERQQAQGIRKI